MQRIEINGNRFYEKDGRRYPSVTSILRYYPKGDGFYKWVGSVGKEEAEKIRDFAGEQGNKVHKAIENYLSNKEIDYDSLSAKESGLVIAFLDWYKDLITEHKVEVVALELPVLNEVDGYAGTIDIVLKIDQEIWIVDIKTSNYVQTTHKLQLSAYRHCLLTEDVKLGIIHLKSGKFIEVEDCFDVFLATKKIFDFESTNTSG